jgi:hypothetical protein
MEESALASLVANALMPPVGGKPPGPPGTTKGIRNFYFWNLDACATLIGRRVMRACPACRCMKMFEGAVFARILIGGIATVANQTDLVKF